MSGTEQGMLAQTASVREDITRVFNRVAGQPVEQ